MMVLTLLAKKMRKNVEQDWETMKAGNRQYVAELPKKNFELPEEE